MLRLFFAFPSLCAIAAAPAYAHPPSAAVAQECFRLTDAPLDRSQEEAYLKGLETWQETCRRALASNGDDPRIKLSLSRALALSGKREEAISLLRAAAEQDHAEALLALYWEHQSFNRIDVNRPQSVTRAEAERALRRAAELGNPDAMFRLASLLSRGGVVKRDPAGARMWGERALAKPPRNMRASDIQVVLGNWLSQSDSLEERKRGIAMLEALPGRGDAQAYLAEAIRASDPVRARALLETALRTYPGHALAPLCDMLIKGEGGPKDERRALALLQGRSAVDAQQAKALLGRLTLEGRLVRRDVAEAVKLLRPWSQWDYDTRLLIMRLVAENPDIQLSHASHFLYEATEAAELGEPGAMDALIALKLSRNPQFSDKAGGCALAERTAKVGDDPHRWPECRAK